MSRTISAYKVKVFSREVHTVTEWREGCVFKTRKMGVVAYDSKNPPFNPKADGYTIY